MEEVIDIRTLQCYQKATEEQRKKCTSKLSFEIGKLPTLKLQEEWTFYIKHCGEVKSLSSVRQETVYFKRVCEFMNHLSVDSMKVQTKAVWGQQFESWVSAQGLKAYRESNKNKNWRERTPIVLYFLHMLDFIDSEMSGQRIYFKDLACYQEASEEERKKCGREPYFDLSLLPTQQLRKEWGAYTKESARIYTLGTSFQHRVYYNQICRFLNSRIVCVKSMREQSKEKWEYQFKRWLMTEGIQINRKSQSVYSKEGIARNPNISYLLRMVDFTCPNIWEDETEKDIWELEKLPIEIKNNPIKKVKTLNFTNIRQPDMRNEIKKGIYLLLQKEAIATVTKGITILVHYTSTSDQAIQSLFSVSNAKAGHENRHFHVYIRPEGVLGCEIRNESAMNYGFKAANAVKADYKGKPAENIIALQADKEKGTYQLFANGEKVLTVDAAALGGYRFISEITGLDTVSLGATKRGGINKYTFGGNIHKIEVYETPLTDEELIEETKKTAYPELQQIFHKNDGTGANYYRIPALLTLKSGTVISAADARFGGTHDSPNNIDIAVARSEDGGKNWSKPELPFHYEDYEDNTLEIPVGTQTRVNQSASFIDPVLLQDEETERVFLISDAMAAGYGSPQAVTGSGYKEIQGKKYLKLQKAGETDYNYTVRENGVIYNDTTNQPTEYSLNSNFEILKDNVLQTVKQKSSRFDPTNGSGQLVTDETDKDVPMNIMYADAVFKALPTTWLYMKYSDDDGKTWSDPILLNGMVKAEDSRVLVTGPGRGMQIKNGEYKGRLIVPVYDTAQSGIIYSDDHGATWNYAKGPSTKKAAMSESQIVEMPDGTLRVYARSTGSKIAEAVSLDGGKTWTEAAYVPGMTQPGWGSQLSVIRYGGLIEGKPALIMSTPAGVGNYRRDGRVKIGLITDTGKEGSEKYKIDWTYDYSVDSKNAGFAYSCLSELPNHQIGLMYEKYDSYNPAELHSQDIMKYEELSLSELMGKEVVEIIPQTEGKGTVSQRNTVKKGSKITIEAYPEEGYQFVRWEDEKGNPVSEQEKYTFDAKESAAFTAVFEQEKEEVDKSHLKEAIRHAEEQMQDEKYQDVIPVVREEYEEAYKNAKAIDEKPDATSEEVETAYKTLIEVGKRLTMYKGDLTELQAAYDLYAGKDLSIYTQDSKTVLEEALKEAEKVLKLGENAVKEDVNEALEKLQKAIEGLEKSEPNPPTDPEFPTDPDSGNTDIVNPDNSLSPDDTPSTNGTPSASDEKAVATGDKETPVGWTTLGFAAMLAAAGRFLGRKKRR